MFFNKSNRSNAVCKYGVQWPDRRYVEPDPIIPPNSNPLKPIRPFIFDPKCFGFHKTDDPWIFNSAAGDIVIEKTTVNSWIISSYHIQDEFEINEILYHGYISSLEFAEELLSNLNIIHP